MNAENHARDVGAIVDAASTSYLGTNAVLAQRPALAADCPDETWLSGCVMIDGDWNGAIILTCPRAFARDAAARMFATAVAEVSDHDTRDALGELVNIVGGNYKAILPASGGTHRLSLPVVVGWPMRLTGMAETSDLWLRVGAGVVRVQVLEAAGNGGA
ncbi:MAG TPA: chemotaxis protein CheX [Myxococcota bacterium]